MPVSSHFPHKSFPPFQPIPGRTTNGQKLSNVRPLETRSKNAKDNDVLSRHHWERQLESPHNLADPSLS